MKEQLVDLVEGLIADDEREGGRTMRELAEAIVDAVLKAVQEQAESDG